MPNKTTEQIRAKVYKGLGISRRKYLQEQKKMPSKIQKYWKHDGPPSHYCVEVDGEVAFTGSYNQGMMFIKSLENDGMISFEEDFYALYSEHFIAKRYYRALMCEKRFAERNN